jgi:hypothetical protein
VKSKDKKNLNNMATAPVQEEEAYKEKRATAPVNVNDESVPRKNATHRKSTIPPFLSMMLHWKMPPHSLILISL